MGERAGVGDVVDAPPLDVRARLVRGPEDVPAYPPEAVDPGGCTHPVVSGPFFGVLGARARCPRASLSAGPPGALRGGIRPTARDRPQGRPGGRAPARGATPPPFSPPLPDSAR